jgi:LAO/AO transport system kinase
MIENEHADKNKLLKAAFPHTGKARLIGITGAPGAGKSSLVDGLIRLLRAQGLKVAIVAVDPTSPFTGGALLGDRVRMQEHATDKGVFIRSMGTRGSLGGLSRNTKDVIHLIDAAGFDVILVETVGVGQSELDIMHIADTTMVVLNPGAGDTVQAFKAGIMEIADLFVINKADLSGAEKLHAEVDSMLDLAKHGASWRPPIVKTISKEAKGIPELWDTVLQHEKYMQTSGEAITRKEEQMKLEVLDIIENQLKQRLLSQIQLHKHESDWVELVHRQKDPYSLAEQWMDEYIG